MSVTTSRSGCRVGAPAGVVLLLGIILAALPALARDIFFSLEAPPTAAEVAQAVSAGVRIFDFDIEQPGADEAITAIKQAGGRITAYHVGGGGGRAWGSVKAGEQVRKYMEPEDLQALTEDVKRLVARGADAIHFDNTHRMSGKRLEAIADAIVAGGAGFVAKNNPDKWRLVMKRRADLVPVYAVMEDLLRDPDDTEAAERLHGNGIAIYAIAFRSPVKADSALIEEAEARSWQRAHSWAQLLFIDDERAFDSRGGKWID